ncbi:MAG: DUF3291 domain-containing protein [Chloroflexi bacterium]|nr:DUF3291 domain-containing protein [Chloroflexota bacterium]
MAKVVLYTFAIFKETRNSEYNKEFNDRNPFVYVSAENSPGFVDRSGQSWKRNHADRNADWGNRDASPRFLTTGKHRDTAATLSVWDDVESVYAFTYAGFHAEVLKMRDDWFVKGDWPAYVSWWIPDGETPIQAHGAERLEHLHDNGSTAYAFDFKAPFDADGQPLTMDRQKIQQNVEVVRSHQRHD